jgi:ribosomal 30S subunit maturation factor RimM
MEADHRLKSVPLDDLIVVARIVKVRGLRGEVAADLLTDFPERFEGVKELIVIAPDESRRSLAIEEHWFHGNRIIMLAGCRVETVDGNPIGEVRDVMRTGGVEILVVANESGGDFLIPMASDICVEIDVEKKLIRVDPPEGLLEL